MNPSPFRTPIGLDQHMLALGTTGSGKSYRTAIQIRGRLALLEAHKIMPNTYKIVIIDTKRTGWGKDNHLGNFVDLIKTVNGVLVWDWRDINWKDDHYLYVWRVEQTNQTERENINAFFYESMNRKLRNPRGEGTAYPFTIVIDELVDIMATDTARVIYLAGLTEILSEGRGAGQTVWIETQTPTYIHGDIKRMSTVRFVFRLPDPDDRDYVSRLLGNKILKERIPDPFGFYYQNDMIQNGELFYYNGRL